MTETSERTMKSCPYCAEQIRDAAIRCRYCGSSLVLGRGRALQWYRLRRGKMIAGVCAGLADYYALPVDAVRAAAVLLTLIGGWGLIVYVLLWVLMPYRENVPSRNPPEAVSDTPGGV